MEQAEEDPSGGRTRANGDEVQGRSLLGNFADTFEPGDRFVYAQPTNATLKTGAAATVSVANGKLQAVSNGVTYVGTDLKQMQMHTQGTGYLVVTEVVNSGTRERYILDYLPTLNSVPEPYCDVETGLAASVLQGEWTRVRERLWSENLTFACEKRGVADKCLEFGYDPGSSTKGEMFDTYQACTQAASAMYCWGDGVSHTYDETPIRIRDYIPLGKPEPSVAPALVKTPLTPWPASPDKIYFESAWIPRQTVPCLSALRWESLPPGAACTDLPDPRDHDTSGTGKFCEDYTYQELSDMGAKVFVGSMTMDKGVYQWTTSNNKQISTAHGYASEALVQTVDGVDYPLRAPPFTGYNRLGRFDGFLLRNLPGSLDPVNDMIEVFVQQNTATNDIVIATSTPVTNGHTVGAREGWLFRNQGNSRVPFNLYKRNGGTDYTSGTVPPNSVDWSAVGAPLGFVVGP